ncbi:MAG: exo 1,3/1,4-beta-D-glucan glucohydrolase [Acidiferrobacterales bacterium]|nr:exo 1,3/1,4-beta-D-glucan glucohydrolase [Acidiferrobacterales bacterium]
MKVSKSPNIKSNITISKPLQIFVLGVALLGHAGCNKDVTTNGPENSTAIAQSKNIDIWPSLDYSSTYNLELENQVSELLTNMTIEQKVAQMIQPEIRDVTVEDMRRYGFGSFLNGGGAFPQNNKHATPEDWINLAEDMYQASIDDSIDGSTIPAIWGTDAVHGHNNVIGATLFPHNIGLGAANDPQLIEEIASATAREVMATGIDWVFAPTVAVVRNDRWGRTYEGYSEDPEIVRDYAAAIVRGLQGNIGDDFLSDRNVISTVKHFLGDGGTQDGVDQGNTIVDEQTLFDIHAQGYVGGLSAGAQSVMASFNSWQGKKLHGHKYLLTDVLKDKIGFDGFVVGDWLGHGQIEGCTNYDCPETINAGLDIFMASGDSWKPLFENTVAQVKSGEIPMTRINDAVSRILRVKLRAGIFKKPSPANRPLSGNVDLIGAAGHREIARRAVRSSLVLLKNENDVLPISPTKHILIAGDAANNIGKQSGGWTITWQGTNNTNEDFPGGSSIYDGFAEAISAGGGEVTLSIDGSYQNKPDVAIVVFGEEPYAEGVGDIKNVAYQPGTQSDLALLEKLKAQGIPVVSVFISGRPLYINAELNASDAFVAAWLPGSEGRGVSDVLLASTAGEIQHDFSGRLSYSWPASPYQSEVNRNDNNYSPLFPYGFGLSYDSSKTNSVPLDYPLALEALNPADIVSTTAIFETTFLEPYFAEVSSADISLRMTSNMIEADNIMVRTIDKNIQEDARQINFTGNANSKFSIVSEEVIDLTEQRSQGQSLFLNLRIESPIQDSVIVGMDCETGCENELDVSSQLSRLAPNEWQEVNISLACFENAGVLLNQVISPLQLTSYGPLTISFSEVSIRSTPNVDECD